MDLLPRVHTEVRKGISATSLAEAAEQVALSF